MRDISGSGLEGEANSALLRKGLDPARYWLDFPSMGCSNVFKIALPVRRFIFAVLLAVPLEHRPARDGAGSFRRPQAEEATSGIEGRRRVAEQAVRLDLEATLGPKLRRHAIKQLAPHQPCEAGNLEVGLLKKLFRSKAEFEWDRPPATRENAPSPAPALGAALCNAEQEASKIGGQEQCLRSRRMGHEPRNERVHEAGRA